MESHRATPLSLRTEISAREALAAALAETQDAFVGDLQSAMLLGAAANTTKATKERERIFELWRSYCEELGVDESLGGLGQQTELRLSYLLVFALRFRKTGRSGKPVRAGSVESALLAVGKGITDLGGQDPRKAFCWNTIFRACTNSRFND